mgnify:CR=1 FL=1
MDEVARSAHASRCQLDRRFRRHVGRSPQAEIRRVQGDKIKQLLHESDYPLKRIAEMTGFEHVEYLSVVFKRLAGDSPGQFRKNIQSPRRS